MRRIELRPAAVAALCLLFYLDPMHVFAPFVLACVLHEAGHLLALAACGASVRSMRLGRAGAVLDASPLPAGRQILCTLAGPAANVLSFCAASRAAPHFAAISALLAVYNLLPIEPLDGGMVLRCALERWLSPSRTDAICRVVRRSVLLLGGLGALWCCFALRGGIWPLLLFLVVLLRLPRENTVANRRSVP